MSIRFYVLFNIMYDGHKKCSSANINTVFKFNIPVPTSHLPAHCTNLKVAGFSKLQAEDKNILFGANG